MSKVVTSVTAMVKNNVSDEERAELLESRDADTIALLDVNTQVKENE